MTIDEFEQLIAKARAVRQAYEQGLVPEEKMQEIIELAQAYAAIVNLIEDIKDDMVLEADVISEDEGESLQR